MLIGYARVSTPEQVLQPQVDALLAAGCERVFQDRVSGALRERPQLNRCLQVLNEGDTLVIVRLDRLGRSLRHLVDILELLRERHIGLRSLTEGIDTDSPNGELKPAEEAYETARKPASEAYNAAQKTASEAYDAAIKTAREAYETARKPASEAYDAALKTAREAHAAALKTAREAYDAAIKTAEEAYETARKPASEAYAAELIFHIFGAVSQFERSLIRERTIDGLNNARARGRNGGRPPKVTGKRLELARSLWDAHTHTLKQIAELLGCSESSVYRGLHRSLKPQIPFSE